MFTLFQVSNATYDRKHADLALENYVTIVIMCVITTFFNSPFSDQSTTIQVRLLGKSVLDRGIENYVTIVIMCVVTTFFNSPFSDQSTTIQVRLLGKS